MKTNSHLSVLFLNYSDERHSEQFIKNMDTLGYHTDIIDEIDVPTRKMIVAFVSAAKGQISHIAVAERGAKTASKKRRVKILGAITTNGSISQEILKTNLSTQFHKQIDELFRKRIAHIPPKLMEAIYRYFFENDPVLRSRYTELMRQFFGEPTRSQEDPVTAFQTEREAVLISLQLAGLFDGFKGALINNATDTPSFLDGLTKVSIREDLQIMNDASSFADWKLVARNALSALTFSNGIRNLTVMYVNRTPIEQNLGVDLIYVDEINRTFIMVQYKRLVRQNNEYVYRPDSDSSYAKELRLMNRFQNVLASQSTGKQTYRYNDDLFYFKLCKNIQQLRGTSLSQGMYIPKAYWEYLYHNASTTGPAGGKTYTYETVRNYLNNTTFINMVQSGLIGSPYQDFDLISSILNDIIRNGKSVVLSAVRTA